MNEDLRETADRVHVMYTGVVAKALDDFADRVMAFFSDRSLWLRTNTQELTCGVTEIRVFIGKATEPDTYGWDRDHHKKRRDIMAFDVSFHPTHKIMIGSSATYGAVREIKMGFTITKEARDQEWPSVVRRRVREKLDRALAEVGRIRLVNELVDVRNKFLHERGMMQQEWNEWIESICLRLNIARPSGLRDVEHDELQAIIRQIVTPEGDLIAASVDRDLHGSKSRRKHADRT